MLPYLSDDVTWSATSGTQTSTFGTSVFYFYVVCCATSILVKCNLRYALRSDAPWS